MASLYLNSENGCVYCGESVRKQPIKTPVKYMSGTKADVEVVQQMLNAILKEWGGPDVPLEVDGICGDKTRAAITKFQKKALGWSDGVVDPNGQTMQRLTSYICDSVSVPNGPLGPKAPKSLGPATPPAPGDATGDEIVEYANFLLRVLEPSIALLRWRMTRLDTVFIQFMNKHFAGSGLKVVDDDMAFIHRVVSRMHHYVARFNAFGKLPIENVLLFYEGPISGAAHTTRGGDKMTLEQVQIYIEDGRLIKSPGQSIWLHRTWAKKHPYEKQADLLHEMAHFVGPRDSHFDTIDDYSYAKWKGFRSLSKFHKLHCADCISLFVMEWCVGTEALLSMPKMAQHAAHYGGYPRVVGNRLIPAPMGAMSE